MERVEDRAKFDLDLFAALDGTDPDRVDERVVNDEMAAFRSFAKDTQ